MIFTPFSTFDIKYKKDSFEKLLEIIFVASWRASFSYFLKVALDHGWMPPIPFRFFVVFLDIQFIPEATSKTELFVTQKSAMAGNCC